MNKQQLLTFEIGGVCNMAQQHKHACPSATIKRPPGRPLSDDEIAECIHVAYGEMGFVGLVAWHWYNEPMLSWERIKPLMKRIKAETPAAGFMLWTNGTRMPKDLSELSIFTRITVANYHGKDWSALGKVCPTVVILPENFDGRLQLQQQASPYCLRPFVELTIDFQGNGRICCIDWQREVDLGNVARDGFREVVRRFLKTRDQITAGEGPRICRSCSLSFQKLDWPIVDGPRNAAIEYARELRRS